MENVSTERGAVRCIAWLDLLRDLRDHPRTEIVSWHSGWRSVPLPYTLRQRAFLCSVEAARNLHQAARFLLWPAIAWMRLRRLEAKRHEQVRIIQELGSKAECSVSWHKNKSNETKVSDGHRERAWLEMKVH